MYYLQPISSRLTPPSFCAGFDVGPFLRRTLFVGISIIWWGSSRWSQDSEVHLGRISLLVAPPTPPPHVKSILLSSIGLQSNCSPYPRCDNILSGYLCAVTTVFSQQDGFYSFKFPKRFLEISSSEISLFSLSSLFY